MKRSSILVKINLLVFGGLVLLLGSAVLSGAIQSGNQAETQVRVSLVGAGVAVSLLVDPEFVASMTTDGPSTAAYAKTEAALERLVAVFGLSDLYVLRPQAAAPDQWEFVFDTLDGPFDKEKGKEGGFTPYESPPIEVAQAWKGRESVVTAEPYTDEFGTFRSAFLTLVNGAGQPVAVIGADFNVTQLNRARQQQVTFALGLAGGGLVLLALLAWILGRLVGRPLRAVSSRFAELAGEQADLTELLTVRTHDELGELAGGFNSFVEKLRLLVTDLQSGAASMAEIEQRLNHESQETSTSVSRTRAGLETLLASVNTLDGAVAEVQSSLESMVEHEQRLGGLAHAQAKTSSDAANDRSVVDQAAVLRREADHLGRALVEADHESTVNLSRMDAGLRVLHELQRQVQSVTGIVQTLVDTAESTALLAMNASIEAAHAGSQGRGFSVIAQRMGQQAATSRADADRIGATLLTMVSLIGEVAASVEATARGSEVVRGRLETTLSLAQTLTQAGESLEAYTQRSRVVLEALQDNCTVVAEASRVLAQRTVAISAAGNALREVSVSVRKETSELLGGANEVAAVVDSVRGAAERLAVVNQSLRTTLSTFKTN